MCSPAVGFKDLGEMHRAALTPPLREEIPTAGEWFTAALQLAAESRGKRRRSWPEATRRVLRLWALTPICSFEHEKPPGRRGQDFLPAGHISPCRAHSDFFIFVALKGIFGANCGGTVRTREGKRKAARRERPLVALGKYGIRT